MPTNVLCVVEELLLWRKFEQQLFAEDVLNIMVKHHLVTVDQVQQMWKQAVKDCVDLQLPLPYVVLSETTKGED